MASRPDTGVTGADATVDAEDAHINVMLVADCRTLTLNIYIYRRGGCGACVLATNYFQWFCMSRMVVRGFLCQLVARLVRMRACFCFQLQHQL